MNACDGTVDETIRRGGELTNVELKRENNINTVHKDVDEFVQKKTVLLETLVQANLM